MKQIKNKKLLANGAKESNAKEHHQEIMKISKSSHVIIYYVAYIVL